jgi:hypothetical protein
MKNTKYGIEDKASARAVGCTNWREWLKKMDHCAKKTGFTTAIVNRCGEIVVTIDSQYGDRILARRQGRNGIYIP